MPFSSPLNNNKANLRRVTEFITTKPHPVITANADGVLGVTGRGELNKRQRSRSRTNSIVVVLAIVQHPRAGGASYLDKLS